MAWHLLSTLGLRNDTPFDELEADDALVFPAGVMALGRGGAGEVGALVRDDDSFVGMLRLMPEETRDGSDLSRLAEALPDGACQILTRRWPVDPERVITRGVHHGLTAELSETISPSLDALAAAGWSTVQTLLAIAHSDPESLRHDLTRLTAGLPLRARPVTQSEAKNLAGDWFEPQASGQITIGWSVTELLAEPPGDWMRRLFDDPALTALPLVVALHLAPVGAPEPVPLEMRRRLVALDAEIEARRRAGRRGGQSDCAGCEDLLAERLELLSTLTALDSRERPRTARLVIGCTVPPGDARAVRHAIELVLHDLGFVARSYGPRFSRDTHLSCAPLCQPLVGRGLTLTARGAALLAPLLAGSDRVGQSSDRQALLPLGLRADGMAVFPDPGTPLLVVGAREGGGAVLRSLVLGEVAAGAAAIVYDAAGRWQEVAERVDGRTLPVALHLGGLLERLGAASLIPAGAPRRIDDWVRRVVALFGDLAPRLSDDEIGDLTAQLLALAEADVAWGEPLSLGPVVAHLRLGSPIARHFAALLTSTRVTSLADSPASPFLALDARGDRDGERLAPPSGVAGVALLAMLDWLAARHWKQQERQLVILDDLQTLLAGAAGLELIGPLLAMARRDGIAVAASLPDDSHDLAALLRPFAAYEPAVLFLPDLADHYPSVASAFDWPDNRLEATGEAVVVRYQRGADTLESCQLRVVAAM